MRISLEEMITWIFAETEKGQNGRVVYTRTILEKKNLKNDIQNAIFYHSRNFLRRIYSELASIKINSY